MEELVTMQEEGQGEEVGEDMLLVIPRAQLLQVRWRLWFLQKNRQAKIFYFYLDCIDVNQEYLSRMVQCRNKDKMD